MKYVLRPGSRPDPNVVLPRLEPHYSHLIALLDEARRVALAMLQRGAEMGMHLPAGSCRSFLVTQAAIELAKAQGAAGIGPLRYRPEGTLAIFEVAEADVLLQFKKERRHRRAITQNHQSERQDQIRTGAHAFAFPGEPAFVYVAYRLDPALSEFTRIAVACPNGYDENLWSETIHDKALGRIRYFPAAERPTTTTAVVAAKNETAIRKRAENGNGRSA